MSLLFFVVLFIGLRLPYTIISSVTLLLLGGGGYDTQGVYTKKSS